MYNFLAAYSEQSDAWVCGILIGIILVCIIGFSIQVIKFFHQENEFYRTMRRRERIKDMLKRNKRRKDMKQYSQKNAKKPLIWAQS